MASGYDKFVAGIRGYGVDSDLGPSTTSVPMSVDDILQSYEQSQNLFLQNLSKDKKSREKKEKNVLKEDIKKIKKENMEKKPKIEKHLKIKAEKPKKAATETAKMKRALKLETKVPATQQMNLPEKFTLEEASKFVNEAVLSNFQKYMGTAAFAETHESQQHEMAYAQMETEVMGEMQHAEVAVDQNILFKIPLNPRRGIAEVEAAIKNAEYAHEELKRLQIKLDRLIHYVSFENTDLTLLVKNKPNETTPARTSNTTLAVKKDLKFFKNLLQLKRFKEGVAEFGQLLRRLNAIRDRQMKAVYQQMQSEEWAPVDEEGAIFMPPPLPQPTFANQREKQEFVTCLVFILHRSTTLREQLSNMSAFCEELGVHKREEAVSPNKKLIDLYMALMQNVPKLDQRSPNLIKVYNCVIKEIKELVQEVNPENRAMIRGMLETVKKRNKQLMELNNVAGKN